MLIEEKLDQNSSFILKAKETINRNPKYAVYDSLTNLRNQLLNNPEAREKFEHAITLFKDSKVQHAQQQFGSIYEGIANLVKAVSILDTDKILTPRMFEVLEQAFSINKQQIADLATKYRESSVVDISNEIQNNSEFKKNTIVQAMLPQLSDTLGDFLHTEESNALKIFGKAILSVFQSKPGGEQTQAIDNISKTLSTANQYCIPS